MFQYLLQLTPDGPVFGLTYHISFSKISDPAVQNLSMINKYSQSDKLCSKYILLKDILPQNENILKYFSVIFTS